MALRPCAMTSRSPARALEVDERRRVRRRALPRGAVAGGAGAVVDLASQRDRVCGRAGRSCTAEPVDRRRLVHVDVEHVQHRIEARAVPFGAAEMAGRRDRALQAGRRVDRPGQVAAELLQRLRVRLGRDVRQIGLGQGLPDERLRLQRERAASATSPRPAPSSAAPAPRAPGTAAVPVSRSSTNVKPIFVSCTTASFAVRPGPDGDQDRRRRIVVVPDVVANGLVVPLALAGRRVEREHACWQTGCRPCGTRRRNPRSPSRSRRTPSRAARRSSRRPRRWRRRSSPPSPTSTCRGRPALRAGWCGRSTSARRSRCRSARMWPGDAS